METEFVIALYSGLYETTPLRTVPLGWSDVVKRLSTYTETPDKFSVSGFGAHRLNDTQRKAAHVAHVSMFVFDVDVGTPETNAKTVSLLESDGLAAHIYSSHSHRLDKPALRLVIPVTRPITPAEYPALRTYLIRRYEIQCNQNQSADVSRFWFDPSFPPGGVPFTQTLDGEFFNADLVGLSPMPVGPPPADWVPPPEPEPEFVEELDAYVDRLRKLANKQARRPDKKNSVIYLRRMLKGEALSDHGSRNQVALAVCGTLAFALPDAPVSILMRLMRPSLRAMINAGSKLTEEKVHRMIVSAMHKRAALVQEEKQLREMFTAQKQAFLPK